MDDVSFRLTLEGEGVEPVPMIGTGALNEDGECAALEAAGPGSAAEVGCSVSCLDGEGEIAVGFCAACGLSGPTEAKQAWKGDQRIEFE